MKIQIVLDCIRSETFKSNFISNLYHGIDLCRFLIYFFFILACFLKQIQIQIISPVDCYLIVVEWFG